MRGYLGGSFILGVRIIRVSCAALAWADMLDAFDARDELDIGRAALAGSIGKGPCACGWFARTWPSALGRAVGPPRCWAIERWKLAFCCTRRAADADAALALASKTISGVGRYTFRLPRLPCDMM